MRSTALVAFVVAGLLAAGCASSRGSRSFVARSSSPYVAAPRVAVAGPTTYNVWAPPPPPAPAYERSYARSQPSLVTPVRRSAPSAVRHAAPAPVRRTATAAAPRARVSQPSGGGLAGLVSECAGGT